MMTSTQVIEMLVTTTDNNSAQDWWPDLMIWSAQSYKNI